MVTLKEKTEISLGVLHDMRQEMIDNMLNKDPEIYEGLHTSDNKTARDLYFDKYLLMWLDDHWNRLEDHIKETYNGHSIYEKEEKNLKEFFIKFFKELNESMGQSVKSNAFTLAIEVKVKAFKEMINLNDAWDKNLAKLRVERKKHKEKFEEMIKKYKDEK